VAQFDFTIRQGDSLPYLTQTFTDSTGTPVDLTGCTVHFVMRTLTASTPAINAEAEIVDVATGQVSFAFSSEQTATAGEYMGSWIVTNGSGGTFTIPTQGYLTISIEENLVTAGGSQIVSLAEIKEALNIPSDDRSHDSRLTQMALDIVPVIEHITGPILQRSCTEWYDGGSQSIILRNRPAVSVEAVSEWWGPIEHVLTQVDNPTAGTMFSFQFEAPGRVTRRGPGGSTMCFEYGPQQVRIEYTAGLETVPPNVTEAALQLIRVHYDRTQARPMLRGWIGDGSLDDNEPSNGSMILGFFVPNVVRELLQPSQKTQAFF